jgi:hypothetical protein
MASHLVRFPYKYISENIFFTIRKASTPSGTTTAFVLTILRSISPINTVLTGENYLVVFVTF